MNWLTKCTNHCEIVWSSPIWPRKTYLLYIKKKKTHDFVIHVCAINAINKCSYFCRSRTILDDFREAYYWLRQNTDDKARIMSWWDYGYQIAGMGNRTTLVDNNTWNNSHIALVSGKTSSLHWGHVFNVLWFKLTMTNSFTCMLFQ